MIHPTAIVDSQALIGSEVRIGPYSVVEGGVKIGNNFTVILSHAVIRKGTEIGSDCYVDSFSVLGGEPNFLGFDPSIESGVSIGDRCTIREHVTIHRSTQSGQSTRIGSDVFLMAGSHAAHDALVGDRVIMANSVALAGHVSVGNDSFIGGNACIHQFTRVGEGTMISGLSRISRDIAPFITVGERNEVGGLNLIGLRRRGALAETIKELKSLYHAILRSPGSPPTTVETLEKPKSMEAKLFIEFFVPSKRGYAKSVVSRD